MIPAASPAGSGRLVELDALRGIAATLVMLFHFTTHYDRLYGHESAPLFSVPWGDHGVNLFFMISGFVIFMTLHRIRRPLDFVVSRFSRLFPVFWTAVLVTFLLSRVLPLPDKSVGAATAAMNLFMFHGLARIPHVDAVYWTLQVELLFYGWALLLYRVGRLDRVHAVLLVALGLRLAYSFAPIWVGVALPSTLGHLLILPYIAWFACGIMVYRRVTLPAETPRADRLVVLAAIAQLGIAEGAAMGLLAAGLTALLWLAATGRLRFLANPLLAWLGAISYSLYLLHENIGWGLMLWLQRTGLGADASILLAISVVLALATLLTRLVEQPAMAWLRRRYRASQVPRIATGRAMALVGVFLSVFAGLAYAWHTTVAPQPTTGHRVAHIHRPPPGSAVACPGTTETRPLQILVLGQSNAGNHGEPVTAPPATYYFAGACHRTDGPAPGATGRGGSPWPLLAPGLATALGRPVVFSVLAVDASTVGDWAGPGAVREVLLETLADQRTHGFVPDLVLWQQGEADARAWTTRSKYHERFGRLVTLLRDQGVTAPILAALSTRCRNDGSRQVREAIGNVAGADPSVRIGPDLDTLPDQLRYDGCHLSAAGLEAAARLWLPAILAAR